MGELSNLIVGTPGETPEVQPMPDMPTPKDMAPPPITAPSFSLGKEILGEPTDAQKIGLALETDKTPERAPVCSRCRVAPRLPVTLVDENLTT